MLADNQSTDVHLRVRLASRAMGRHGLTHAYGHVSQRISEDAFLVSPPQPLSTVAPHARGTEVALTEPLPEGVLGEVRLHREIYRRRPDVGGICRIQPPAVMALSVLGATPRTLHGLGTYFFPAPPLWNGTALVRDDEMAAAVAEHLGEAVAIVLRGNGAVVTGAGLEAACANAYFLEDAARVELALLPARTAALDIIEYSAEEAAARATSVGGIYERMWEFLCFGDLEWKGTA
ncbi:class II aldolase/adducin family protein [Kineobactrum salinum]|uniref:Class II aldolase/adducin family protein n=1 Tax=Kineobactrum salinum TaxID=2708301 RepID=A0A6C0TZ28_9GAMM|nr:class II aldolase/adducin family protein [Kineobactrum salinum]QIB64908.1 class II aldolase/adducin family protein [Kineobactrum salinum]